MKRRIDSTPLSSTLPSHALAPTHWIDFGWRHFLCYLACLPLLAGCQPGVSSNHSPPPPTMSKLSLSSGAFREGELIPKRYTCDGENVSPPLAWTPPPAGTRSQALICDDPDAPLGTWVHWVLFNLPATTTRLPEGIPVSPTLEDGAAQGNNDFHHYGYGGPCPPPGPPHRYVFHLYALDAQMPLGAGATKQELLNAIQGHVLAEGRLIGRYQRKTGP